MKTTLLTLTVASFAFAATAAANPGRAAPINATYSCTNGNSLRVAFDGDKAIVTTKNDRPITLTQSMSGDGFLYSDGKHSLRGRGDDATWTKTGYKPLQCSTRRLR